MSHASRGLETELKCKAKLVELGFEVLEPLSAVSPYDCLVLGKDKFAKIQIKRAYAERAAFRARLSAGGKGKKVAYSPRDVDFFLISVEDDFYVVPRIPGCSCPSFRSKRKTLLNMEAYKNSWYLIKEKLGSCAPVNAKTVMRIISL